MIALQHQFILTNSIQLHVVQAGPESGPLVILLHGFPDYWRGWQMQLEALAEAGYWVWVPDQRGYNLSDKPRSTAAYRLDKLAADIIGLINAAGREKAMIVGHDWGAAVAWWLGIKHPTRVEKLVILNGPHPIVMARHMRRDLGQLGRSAYMFFFQLPWIPEWLSRLNNWRLVTNALRRTSRPGTFSEEMLAGYRHAWSQPGAFTAMLNWYRAIFRHPPSLGGEKRITVPTLLIWGTNDFALEREMAAPSIELCDRGQFVFFEEASHWVQQEEGERVNSLLLSFLKPAGEQ
jgi:pimeloyl-ACP methyl ester carboxylesterase